MAAWKLAGALICGFYALSAACADPVKSPENPDIAMVTAVSGTVDRVTPQGRQTLPPFGRVKRGELLALSAGRLQLLYFASGRQEEWQGTGRLEVAETQGNALGLAPPVVKVLPVVAAKQISRAPVLDERGEVRVPRVRAIAAPDAIERLDETYRRMRMEAVRGDLNPELFLLSGLFEMREFDRVEQLLTDLRRARPGDMEIGLLVTLYQKAIRNARESRGS